MDPLDKQIIQNGREFRPARVTTEIIPEYNGLKVHCSNIYSAKCPNNRLDPRSIGGDNVRITYLSFDIYTLLKRVESQTYLIDYSNTDVRRRRYSQSLSLLTYLSIKQ